MSGAIKVGILTIAITLIIANCDGANILCFYPFPGISHHRVYWPLIKQLAINGHNVTMVSPFKMPDPPTKNYKEIPVPDYGDQCKKLEENLFMKETNPILRFLKNDNLFMLREMGLFFTEAILTHPTFKWLLASDSKFDLIFGEFTFGEESFMALTHRFGANYIEMTSFGNYHWGHWLNGVPIDNSYVVDISLGYTDRMSFVERLHNTAFSLSHRLIWRLYYIPKLQSLADKHVRYPGWRNRPPLLDMISRNTSLYLIDTHYSLNYAYPLSPNVKEIGGINIPSKDSPLPKDIQSFMDGAKDGVIYFSMGTYFTGSATFDDRTRDVFVKLFSTLKQRVIWKWEKEIPNLPANIKINKWWPQTAILAHQNCVLFMSHGGFLSLSETIDKGVPMVALPVFADQFRNAACMMSKGIGIRLDLSNLTHSSLTWAVNEVLSNKRYKQNAKEQSRIFRDKPETALETAVYWTEYVIRHKGAHHLRPAIATMPWYQQAMIDVYATLAIIIVIPIYLLYKLLSIVIKCLCCGKSNKRNSKIKVN